MEQITGTFLASTYSPHSSDINANEWSLISVRRMNYH